MRSILLIATLAVSACAAPRVQVDAAPVGGEALTLTSHQDGTIRRHGSAVRGEVCVKSETLAVQSCYARGEPIVDPETQRVIGYQMVMTSLDMQAQ